MTETVAYEVTGTIGEIEFRKYPRMTLASVKSNREDSGFNLLFGYITGNNRTRTKISMTSPVITSEQVPMTSPVISDEQSMSFVMPADKTEKDILRDVSRCDVYESESLGRNKISYAVSFILQDEHRTLTDKNIDKVMNNFIRIFEKELDAHIR